MSQSSIDQMTNQLAQALGVEHCHHPWEKLLDIARNRTRELIAIKVITSESESLGSKR